MNPTNGPVGPEFKTEALEKKFSYSFSRKQLIILVNALRPMQLPLHDLRTRTLLEILDEIERTAIQSITPDDYEKPDQPAAPVTPAVQTN